MVKNPSNKVKSELIDGVILRLLGLKPGVEIDYQTYHDIIKKKLAIARLSGKELPREEDELLREEFKRVRKEKDKGIRFKVKTKKIRSKSSTPQTDPNQKQLPGTGSLVKYKKQSIKPSDLLPVKVEDVSEEKKDDLSPIKKTLDSILKILESKFKFDQKQLDKERKEKESEKRGKRESTLEGFKKGVAGIVGITKKILSPFQAIIDRIWRFIFFTLLGRGFTKFMEWMSDKENQKKFSALVDFFVDHWPALVGLYVLFGTSFGKLIRGLLKASARMIVALVMNIGKVKKFITKHKKLAFLGSVLAPLASRELGNIFGENKETPESGLIPNTNSDLKESKDISQKASDIKTPTLNQFDSGGIIPKFNLGGMISDTSIQLSESKNFAQSSSSVPSLKQFNDGGIIPKFNLGGFVPSFELGAINPFGEMDFQSGVPITGAGQDDTLIAAKTGEAILTEKDQQDIGQRYVDRVTGQPLNIPQYLAGRKPGQVSMGNLRFSGFGGGFSHGGIIQKFNTGGIIGGLDSFGRGVFENVGGSVGRNRGRETNLPGGGWFGEQVGRRKGKQMYDNILSPLKKFNTGGVIGGNTNTVNKFNTGGGFSHGGIIQKLNTGGVIGGNTVNKFNTGGVIGGNANTVNKFNTGGVIGGNTVNKFNTGGVINNKNSSLLRPQAKVIFNKLVSGGLTPTAAAGIVANIGVETGYTYSPSTLQLGGGPGRGLVQWEKGGRFDTDRINLTSFAKSRGTSWTDLNTQVDFILHELNNHPEYKIVKNKINSAKDIPTATNIFLRDYEKAGTPHIGDRLKVAQQIVNSGYLNKESKKVSGQEGNKLIKPKERKNGMVNPTNILSVISPFLSKILPFKVGGTIGRVEESEGMNIPGATADRQLFPIVGGGKGALQPGETVITKIASQRYGYDKLEKINALDPNSESSRRGVRPIEISKNINRPIPQPYKTGMGAMVTLPPIDLGMGSSPSGKYAVGSEAPSFSAISPVNDRDKNAKLYYGLGA